MKKIVAVCVFVIGIFCLIPSSAVNVFFRRFDIPLALKNGAGTIWSGEGDLFFSPPPGKSLKPFRVLERLKWNLRLSRIFSGILVVVFQSEQLQDDVSLSLTTEKVSVSGFKIFSNAEILEKGGEPFHTLALHGVMVLESEGMSFSNNNILGRVDVHFDLISSRLMPGVGVLGNYDLHIVGVGNSVSVNLISRDALIAVKGAGTADLSRRRFIFKGFAEASPQAPVAVQNILRLVGHRLGSRTVLDSNFSW